MTKDDLRKSVLLISSDRPTAKLIDLMLESSDISTKILPSPGGLENPEIGMGDSLPNVIIYDCGICRQGDGPVCEPLKEFRFYDNTPRMVISTFKIECRDCGEFESGRCAHLQKPFTFVDMTKTLKDLLS